MGSCGSVYKFVGLQYWYKPLSIDMNFLNFFFFFFGALFWKPGRTNSFLFLVFFLSPLLVFGNDNMKLFLQLVPGIIFKQIFFPPLNCVTFAHLPLKKNPRSFYEGYPDIYISM